MSATELTTWKYLCQVILNGKQVMSVPCAYMLVRIIFLPHFEQLLWSQWWACCDCSLHSLPIHCSYLFLCSNASAPVTLPCIWLLVSVKCWYCCIWMSHMSHSKIQDGCGDICALTYAFIIAVVNCHSNTIVLCWHCITICFWRLQTVPVISNWGNSLRCFMRGCPWKSWQRPCRKLRIALYSRKEVWSACTRGARLSQEWNLWLT